MAMNAILESAHARLTIDYRAPSALKPDPRNARTHPKRQVAQIAASIAAFGFTNPILVDEEGVIVAGHGRLLAAKQLGLESVPVITLVGLTDTQRRALRLADNKIAQGSGWDMDLVRIELTNLGTAATAWVIWSRSMAASTGGSKIAASSARCWCSLTTPHRG